MAFEFPHVEEFGAMFAAALPDEWDAVGTGRERFGSWEWRAVRWPDRRRPRNWLVLAVTPTAVENGRPTRAVTDAWAAAEIRQRFSRTRIATVDLDLSTEAISDRRQVVQTHVLLAARRAEQLRAAQIASTYRPLEHVEPTAPPEVRGVTGTARRVFPTTLREVEPEAWTNLLADRDEISLSEAAATLERPAADVFAYALEAVREGRLRLEQRGREIYLLRASGELNR